MESAIVWGANDQDWSRDKGASIVNIPLKDIPVVHDGCRTVVQLFLDMPNHGYFHIWTCRGSRLLGKVEKSGRRFRVDEILICTLGVLPQNSVFPGCHSTIAVDSFGSKSCGPVECPFKRQWFLWDSHLVALLLKISNCQKRGQKLMFLWD